jgi:choline dehydrogenase
MANGQGTPAAQATFVVIGAGSAGCALAGRLAEAGRDVLLIEAGPDYGPFRSGLWPTELIDARMLATTHDWGYTSGRWTFERARVIGGCSSHNGAIAAVGHRVDYDAWGLPGWSAADVAPLFAEVIRRMRVRTYQPDEVGPFHARCMQAAAHIGWRMADDLCDLDANDSFGLETVNVVGTTRWNAGFAYIDPVRDGGHLQIVDEVLVDRIETGAGTVRVHGRRQGRRYGEAWMAEGATVAVTGGAYGTPAILQRSGIGDPELLASLGIEIAAALPGVGQNLHDHPMVHADRAVGADLQQWLDEAAATGFLPEEQTLGKAISSLAIDGLYDTHVFPVCASDQTSFLHGRAHVEVACMTPQSRGHVRIISSDPTVAPEIDHGYLNDPAGHDLAVLRDGLVLAEQLLDHPVLASVLGNRFTDMSTDQAIRDQVAHYYHPVGTCRMGTDAGSVCDATGRVHGVAGVVVADVCLMPQIPRGNTNLPAVMIGEQIARSLLQR